MKNKVLLIITGLIGIIEAISTLIARNEIIKNTINQLTKINSSFKYQYINKMIELYQQHGNLLLFISSSIVIIICTLILYITFKDRLKEHKGLLIFLLIVLIFFTNSSVLLIMSIVSIIFLNSIKGVKRKDNKEEVELPSVEHKESSNSEKVLGILLLILYFSQLVWGNYLPDDKKIVWMALIIFEIVVLICSIIVFRKEIIDGIKKFKENYKVYLKFIFTTYIIGFLLFIIANIIATALTGESSSVNQSLIESLPLWYVIPSSIIYAPIVEEVLFRGVIRRLINNNILFIIISGLVFGFLHATSEATLFNMLVITFPYAILGATMAYIYVKTDNITSNMFIHFIHNSIAVILMVLL